MELYKEGEMQEPRHKEPRHKKLTQIIIQQTFRVPFESMEIKPRAALNKKKTEKAITLCNKKSYETCKIWEKRIKEQAMKNTKKIINDLIY